MSDGSTRTAYRLERLGELLLSGGTISEEQLTTALEIQRREGGKLGQILVSQLLITEEQLARLLAEQKGLPYVTLTAGDVDRAAVSLIPERLARRRTIIPIGFEDERLVLAMSDPLDIETVDDVEYRTGFKVAPAVATPTQINYAIEKYITSADAFQELKELGVEEESVLPEVIEGDDVPVVRIVNQVIREAVIEGASDIHVEPTENGLRVRYRIDGVLKEMTDLPRSAKAGVISRMKIMADMDIAERRLPQDGRIGVKVDDQSIDLRVASLPTPHGESLVIRVLNSELSFHAVDDLGLDEDQRAALGRMLSAPYGAILVSGPTGSGKSTTLYAALTEISTPERKVITVEDPIEYRMKGITQIAVNPKIGLTFARGLRTILRSDPDVVMVGEVRDPETAEIAVRAALTGHLVLTSLHTNDAPSALTRLTDMGVAPYITSSAVIGVIAQRLVRTLCPACKAPVQIPVERLIAAGFREAGIAKAHLYGPVGCDSCSRTGYRGRQGIFEVMELNDDIVRAYLAAAPAEELRRIALERGMRPLRHDALRKVAMGQTSLDEVDRVVVQP